MVGKKQIPQKETPFDLFSQLRKPILQKEPDHDLVSSLKKQVQQKEEELEKMDQINKNFERMMQLVNIMGQVNTFLASRGRSVIKKIAMLADADQGQYEREFDKKYFSTK